MVCVQGASPNNSFKITHICENPTLGTLKVGGKIGGNLTACTWKQILRSFMFSFCDFFLRSNPIFHICYGSRAMERSLHTIFGPLLELHPAQWNWDHQFCGWFFISDLGPTSTANFSQIESIIGPHFLSFRIFWHFHSIFQPIRWLWRHF